jgi:hypothetical protein
VKIFTNEEEQRQQKEYSTLIAWQLIRLPLPVNQMMPISFARTEIKKTTKRWEKAR